MTYRDQPPAAYENRGLVDAIDRHEQAGLDHPEGTEQRQVYLDRSDAAFEQLMDRMYSGPCSTCKASRSAECGCNRGDG